MSDAKFDAAVECVISKADALADLAKGFTGFGQRPSLNDLQVALAEFEEARYPSKGQSHPAPFTAIEEKIDRAGWVLLRLVGLLGFQAELRVYNGDYGQTGTNVFRGVRINVLRRSFETEHIRELTKFAEEHGCDLEFSQEHGATLRLKSDSGERKIQAVGEGTEFTSTSMVFTKGKTS